MATSVEKQPVSPALVAPSTTSDSTDNHTLIYVDTEKLRDEARARRKVDLTVLPLLTIGLFVFQLDRTNLGSALTGGFSKDVGIKSQNIINAGNQLMFGGIVLLEIPSNMILQRMGPRKYMSLQVFVFGLVAAMQYFITNQSGFLASRFILGLCEAGYIPGALYVLSTWYTKDELARRIGIFFFGMFGGTAFSPLLASGILKLHGTGGITGWRWIFLLEGCLTIFISFVLLIFLPGSPQNPKPLFWSGLIRFTDRDCEVLRQRLEAQNGLGAKLDENGMIITPRKVLDTVLHYRRWPHYFSTFAVFACWAPLTTYTPTIIMKLGFNRIQANALASVGGVATLFVAFFFAYISDRTQRRGITVAVAITCYLITLIILRTVHPHVGNKWQRYALWTVVNSFAVGYHPIHNTWVQLNCTDPQERSIAICMWVMSAISGLMVGSQIFQQNDGPFYKNGIIIMIGMVSFGLLAAGFQMFIYRRFNKNLREQQSVTSGHNTTVDEKGQNSGEEVALRKRPRRAVPYVL